MDWDLVQSFWPELLAIALSIVALHRLIRWSGASLQLSHLRKLHHDQVGGVQTLSFVLTVPLFLFIMMFIVQLSQITIAKVVVEYASYAAARAAVVWIPATSPDLAEGANQISQRAFLRTDGFGPDDQYFLDDNRPLDVTSQTDWASHNVDVYQILPGTPKYDRIQLAAAIAMMPVCPSHELELGGSLGFDSSLGSAAFLEAYQAYEPDSVNNGRIPARLQNKLNYALANTEIDIQVGHRDSEVPLWILRTPDQDGWEYNEIGWQDQITVTVTHHYALLPGPARLLARRADAPPGTEVDESYDDGSAPDTVAQQVVRRGDYSTYAIQSTTRLINQGHIPGRRFVQDLR